MDIGTGTETVCIFVWHLCVMSTLGSTRGFTVYLASMEFKRFKLYLNAMTTSLKNNWKVNCYCITNVT
jgi:hypothetical protein